MEQKNRIKVVHDKRTGAYLLLFVIVSHENGVETEQEVRRLVFKDKADFLEFKQAAVIALETFS